MCLGKRAASIFNRVFDYVDTIVIARLNLTSIVEQDVSAVAAEVEHQLAAPVRVVQLLVEIRKLTGLNRLRAQRPLLRCASPDVNFFDIHPAIRVIPVPFAFENVQVRQLIADRRPPTTSRVASP